MPRKTAQTRFTETSYLRAVRWIADNDEPTWEDIEQVKDLISVQLVSHIFAVPAVIVAGHIVSWRKSEKD